MTPDVRPLSMGGEGERHEKLDGMGLADPKKNL